MRLVTAGDLAVGAGPARTVLPFIGVIFALLFLIIYAARASAGPRVVCLELSYSSFVIQDSETTQQR